MLERRADENARLLLRRRGLGGQVNAVGEREPPAPVPSDEDVGEGVDALLLLPVVAADARALDAGEDGGLAVDAYALPLALDRDDSPRHGGDALEEVGA